ncbi:hypothetical protein HZS_7730 [Henneguya salminicola]|nr:hypothetical protein HZS_7730 [Henneguya salminicola]
MISIKLFGDHRRSNILVFVQKSFAANIFLTSGHLKRKKIFKIRKHLIYKNYVMDFYKTVMIYETNPKMRLEI